MDTNKIDLALEALKKKKIDVDTLFGEAPPIESIPSGSIALDWALGNGGWPRGRISQVYGPKSAGKSTLALYLIKNAQEKGEACLYIDSEYAFDPRYAKALGVKVEMPHLILFQPNTAEEAMEVIDTFLRIGSVGVVVIDSIAALVPKARFEASYEQQDIGLLARLLSYSLPKIVSLTHQSNAVVLCINQIRDKIRAGYSEGKTTPGGNALGFYSSVIVELNPKEPIKSDGKVVAIRSRARVVKNKAAVPYGEAEFVIEFGKGISRETELLELGLQCGLIEQKGAWYTFGDFRWQGAAAAKKFFRETPEVAQALETEIRNIFASKERVIGDGAGVRD